MNGDKHDLPPVDSGDTMTSEIETTPSTEPAREGPSGRALVPGVGIAAGAVAGVVAGLLGLLPWLITGMRLPPLRE